jgi:hypothetical protein
LYEIGHVNVRIPKYWIKLRGKIIKEETMKRTLNTTLAIVCVAAVLGGIQVQAQETRSP